MDFLDRRNELDRLDGLVARRAAGLVAVWGRRRVGKTRLLTQWCHRHNGVYTVADQSAEPVQRRYFAEAIAGRLQGFSDSDYPGWLPLLRRLSRDARTANWRGPLVLDEFPCLVASSPTLPSILQNWIDQESSSGGLLVAIAGSSQRMMQGMVLDASAPLYGRALEAFPLQPLPAGWIGQALGLDEPAKMVQAYTVWGGIPRYWELAEPFHVNLDQAVEKLVLDPLGPLHREPDRLLLEEMPSAVALRPLLDVIGSGAHRLSEIAGRLGQPATSLSRPLGRLVDLGLVQREIPFGRSEKSSRRTIYRIADPFFRFWFHVVAPHRATLASAPHGARLAVWQRLKDALEAETWETLCRSAVPRLPALCEDTKPDDTWMPGRRWWQGREPEWDVVSTTTGGHATLVGEVKWSSKPLGHAEIERLARALLARPLPPGLLPQTRRVLFVPRPAPSATVTNHGVHVIDAEAVMKALV
ncbi:MAG: ATP-binding protein [Acidobacteria bacterium]|nr:ATP-binding protein [Acidobacteriota bacterium]